MTPWFTSRSSTRKRFHTRLLNELLSNFLRMLTKSVYLISHYCKHAIFNIVMMREVECMTNKLVLITVFATFVNWFVDGHLRLEQTINSINHHESVLQNYFTTDIFNVQCYFSGIWRNRVYFGSSQTNQNLSRVRSAKNSFSILSVQVSNSISISVSIQVSCLFLFQLKC